MKSDLADLLAKALAKRQRLFNVTNAVRLVNGAGDGLKGLIVERYDRHIAIWILDGIWHHCREELVSFFHKECHAVYCVIKDRSVNASAVSDAFTSKVYLGQDSRTIVQEYGISFHVDLNDGLNSGLFLDMRKNRHMVAGLAKQKKALNCFAYTCSFGLHCKAAGASNVTNVDISKRYLDRGQANYALNALPIGEKEFVRADAQFYLERAVAKNNFFDLIILDPPSFSRHDKKTFKVKKDLEILIQLSLKVLESYGHLFVSTNYSGITLNQLESMIHHSVTDRRIKTCVPLSQDSDFVGSGKTPESYLAAFLVGV